MAAKQEKQGWMINKHIPVEFIIAMIIQTIAIVGAGSWWASRIDTRVDYLELEIVDQDEIADRLSRVETGITFMRDDLRRLNKKLDEK